MIHTTQEHQIGDNVELMREKPAPPRSTTTGRFLTGARYSPNTEFKKGQHWREPKPYWNKEWLFIEYVTKMKSAERIAQEHGCTPSNILYFIKKFGITTRTMKQIRSDKYWGLSGEQNGMYGRRGEDNPNWLGGITPDRQIFYTSSEWREAVKVVWKRDKAACSRCGAHKSDSGCMHIHHITTFAVEDMRSQLDNLILVCKKCHNWIHSKKNIYGHFIAHPTEEVLK